MPQTRRNSGRGLTVLIVVAILLLPLLLSIVSRFGAPGADAAEPFLEKVDPKFKGCVKSTEYMRYHHWEYLRGYREDVVRYGYRQELVRDDYRGEMGLSMCKDCHTSRERFCDRCHEAASMATDCFGCHYYP